MFYLSCSHFDLWYDASPNLAMRCRLDPTILASIAHCEFMAFKSVGQSVRIQHIWGKLDCLQESTLLGRVCRCIALAIHAWRLWGLLLILVVLIRGRMRGHYSPCIFTVINVSVTVVCSLNWMRGHICTVLSMRSNSAPLGRQVGGTEASCSKTSSWLLEDWRGAPRFEIGARLHTSVRVGTRGHRCRPRCLIL